MNRAPVIKGLYAITPDCADTANLLHRVRQALNGGVRILQYRNKAASAMLRLTQAAALRELTHEFAIPLIVNDDVHLAAQVNADGVHLGAQDGDLQTARNLLGQSKIIGISCYNRLARARDGMDAGADYVALGAFFPSSVKPDAVTADIGLLRQARAELNIPLVALGGVTPCNGAALIRAGANALAVISALFDATDIRAAAQDFTKLFTQDPAS